MSKIIARFAAQRRRIVADWRILVEYRRLASNDYSALPTPKDASRLIKSMLKSSEISPITGVRGVYRIDAAFAAAIPTSDEQVVQEAHPFAVLAFHTALLQHSLTDLASRSIYAVSFAGGDARRTPLGTTSEDWIDLPMPRASLPKVADATAVEWTRAKSALDFGHTTGSSMGIAVYVSDVERTLIDVIQHPRKSGGILNAFKAWRRAGNQMNVDRLIGYVDRIGNQALRQRIGFLLESIGQSHPELARWERNAVRGGSMRLVAQDDYAPEFSKRWNLSINVPSSALNELAGADE